jgi:hypothetical protein
MKEKFDVYLPIGKTLIFEMVASKEIQIILRLFLVIAMYCQASSSQFQSITQPPALLAGWEGSLSKYMQ